MGAPAEDFADCLSTIHHDDPQAIRTRVAETIEEHFDTDLALYFQCAKDSEGEYQFTAPVGVGNDLVDKVLPFTEGPALECPWLPHNIEPEVVDRFICVHRFYPDEYLRTFETVQQIMIPYEITGQLRAVFYDGGELLGWVGMMRRGDNAVFRDAERDRMRAAKSEIKSLLSMAKSLASETIDRELFAVFTPAGKLEYASDTFSEWTNEVRSSYLRHRARGADGGADRLGIEIRGGAEIRMTRLDGNDGVRYLVSIDRPELAEIRPAYWLTDRQREVAEYAVAGATNKEIGETLDISPETVKVHLRNAYERLGIGSRTELAGVLGDGS